MYIKIHEEIILIILVGYENKWFEL